ncbi:hypothetical protein CKM354_001239700 [Cercospora kikuchii]|uniref:SnoaL-like domain-containing protein n=1 Tax=Cercospora kikuchii TaxID=84275 RepID=A0A9P3FLX6_9PEZI|nr:uncharacterized protein CKM354_001239700 [Cercospora kikuchii]GIZ49367.1 hypothetical protein CKM354_001239700 [Cercospora kikuchii]
MGSISPPAEPQMALPAKLSPALSDREAVADTLSRFCLGMDTNDVELFDSAFTTDAFWDLSGKKVHGLEAIHKECYYYNIVRLDTTHMVSNVRVHIEENGTEASMTCLYVAWHWPGGMGMHPDSHRFTTGGQYYFDVVKDNASGLWKAKTFRMKKQWSEGDIAVMGHKKPVEMLKTELEMQKMALKS